MYGRIYVRCLDRYNPKFLMLISFVIVPIATYMEIQHQGLSISTELAQMGNGADSWVGGLNGLALGAMLFTNLSWFFGWLGGNLN